MADDNLFDIELVTPERILVTGSASEVILRTREGDITFLAGHAPLVGTVEPGVVRVVRDDGVEERVAAHGGFVQVEHGVPSAEVVGATASAGSAAGAGRTRVTLLVGVAELAEEIDSARARAALQTAEARVIEVSGGVGGRPAGTGPGEGEEVDPELVEAEEAVRRAEVRLETIDESTGVATAGAGAGA